MHLRPATTSDVPSLYTLWARTFDAPLMVPVYETDDDRLARTVVAVDAGGSVVASACWTPRVLTAADGARALRAGCVANVATAPEARGQGLVRRTLAAALAQMDAAGTDVSLLFTGTPDVYRSSGYSTFDVPVLTGDARPATVDASDDLPAVRVDRLPGDAWSRWEPALPWEALARLHDAADTAPGSAQDSTAAGALRRRPLATVRSAEHWRRRVPLWYRSCELLTARASDGDVVGYVVLEPARPEARARLLRVRELAADPAPARGARAAAALAAATLTRARRHGAATLEVRLPQDGLGRAFTDAVLVDATASVDTTGMLRPVRAGRAEVDALRASTVGPAAGFHWPADYV